MGLVVNGRDETMSEFTEEVTTTIDGWVVTYPSECNGALRDLGFVYPVNGNSNFVHFNEHGLPYGTYMPEKVARRLVAMRRRHLKHVHLQDG